MLEVDLGVPPDSFVRCSQYLFHHKRRFLVNCIHEFACISIHHATEDDMEFLLQKGKRATSDLSLQSVSEFVGYQKVYKRFGYDGDDYQSIHSDYTDN